MTARETVSRRKHGVIREWHCSCGYSAFEWKEMREHLRLVDEVSVHRNRAMARINPGVSGEGDST